MKILVVAPSWIGDTVLSQPLFRLLHQRYPGLQLDVIGPPWTLPLLRRMPEVRRASAHGFAHGELKLGSRFRLGRELAREGYDQAIVLPNTLKSALITLFAGIRRRTGYRGESRWLVLNDMRHLDERALPQIAQRYAALGLDQGMSLPARLPLPHLTADPAAVRRTLERHVLGEAGNAIAFCPGAEYGPAKRWPAPYFAELARKLSAEGHPVWLIGSSNDAAVGEEIERLAPGAVVNLCGKTALDEAIDLLAAAHLVVTNDTGLMHIAAALGTPLLALYGSSTPTFTPPMSEAATILKLDMPCSPCFERTCPLGHFDCMNRLKPANVHDRVMELLAQLPQPHEAMRTTG
ncbi:MAG: lipopolysaccharide heptosyltransferase II [Rhodospirillaceae bacterium]